MTVVKDVLSLHFINRDSPLAAHSACHREVALCALTLDVAQAFENSHIKCLSKLMRLCKSEPRAALFGSSEMP